VGRHGKPSGEKGSRGSLWFRNKPKGKSPLALFPHVMQQAGENPTSVSIFNPCKIRQGYA